MAKYYIQSGEVSYIVAAQDIEGAAMWVMHQTIEKMVDSYDLIEEDSIFEPTMAGLAMFDATINCSEIGLGRDEAGSLDTDKIFRTWQQLMAAADRLFDQLN